MKVLLQASLLFAFTFLFVQCSSDDNGVSPDEEPAALIDIDGNTYQTVKVGNQIWMAENLKVKSFNDGQPITQWQFGDSWYNLNNPITYWQWAGTSDLNNLYEEELPDDFYGAMYNELVLSSGKLAPEGWRIPTVADFEELEAHLAANGQSGTEATALKSSMGWASPENAGTNTVGLNVMPNGYVAAGGTATGAEVIATLATSNIDSTDKSRTVLNLSNGTTMSYSNNSWALGAGVRCIKE